MIGEEEPRTHASVDPTNDPIWRYTSLAKFINVVRRGSKETLGELVFRRADLLNDEYEGTLPDGYKQYQMGIFRSIGSFEATISPEEVGLEPDQGPYDDIDLLERSRTLFRKRMRKITYLNCWRKDEYESSNMWRAYTTPSDGIVIRSTVEDFLDAFQDWENRLFISEVEYKDFPSVEMEFPTEDFVDLTALSPFFLKREQFKDEREIRAVITDYSHPKLHPSGHLSHVPDLSPNDNRYATVNLERLIDQIVVHPESRPYLKKTVKHVLSKHGLDPDLVTESSLKSDQENTDR